MIKLALIGRDISHSKSPELYKDLLVKDHEYTLIDIDCDSKLPSLNDLVSYDGVSITAPYKKHYVEGSICDDVSSKLGLVNCIRVNDEKHFATNTDFLAANEIFKSLNSTYSFEHFIILGSGAMSELFSLLFKQKKIPYVQFSRNKNGPIEAINLDRFDKALVVNCCSRDYVFNGLINKNSLFWDLNYDLVQHKQFFSSQNFLYYDGQEFLKLQAEHSLKFWGLN